MAIVIEEMAYEKVIQLTLRLTLVAEFNDHDVCLYSCNTDPDSETHYFIIIEEKIVAIHHNYDTAIEHFRRYARL